MIAFIIHTARSMAAAIAEAWRFTVEVIEDIRATRAEIEKQYGPLGF
jgi:hypothetical protein